MVLLFWVVRSYNISRHAKRVTSDLSPRALRVVETTWRLRKFSQWWTFKWLNSLVVELSSHGFDGAGFKVSGGERA
jgi:hypothetical protein